MTPGTGATPQRVVLHVGVPKSGTSFLQRTLWRHREELLEMGVVAAGRRHVDMFHGAVEVRDAFGFWGLDRERLTGTWQRLCGGARRFDGTTIMSHELLSAAREDEVARALAPLEGLDVHVVITARDLARQVTSEWQERVKNGNAITFARFQRGVEGQIARGDFSSSFWRFHHLVGVLDRWAGGLPPANVHVVVAPPAGGPPDLLWRRFGDAVGYDAARVDPTAVEAAANQTLGTAQVAVLRRVNTALEGRIPQPHYARIVKRQFAQRVLAGQEAHKPRCPADLVERLRELALAQNVELEARGYQVYGSLDELVPARPATDQPHPDDVAADDVATASIEAIADLLVERLARSSARSASDPELPHRSLVRRAASKIRRQRQPR